MFKSSDQEWPTLVLESHRVILKTTAILDQVNQLWWVNCIVNCFKWSIKWRITPKMADSVALLDLGWPPLAQMLAGRWMLVYFLKYWHQKIILARQTEHVYDFHLTQISWNVFCTEKWLWGNHFRILREMYSIAENALSMEACGCSGPRMRLLYYNELYFTWTAEMLSLYSNLLIINYVGIGHEKPS